MKKRVSLILALMVTAPCMADLFPLTERQKHIATFGVPVAGGLAFQFITAGFKQRTVTLPVVGLCGVAVALTAFIKMDPLSKV